MFLGNGDATFQNPISYNLGAGFTGFLMDADGDGQPDILAAVNPTGTLTQIVFSKGKPDGTFASAVVLGSLPANVTALGVGDFNGDGILDLEVMNGTGIGVLLGQPGMTFSPMLLSLGPGTPNAFAPAPANADFDKDGNLDLAAIANGGIVL